MGFHSLRTVGPWSIEEKKFHMNVAELRAVKLAIMSFTLKEKNAISVHIRMDKMTVLSYLMKMKGTKNQELTAIRKEIWQYLLGNSRDGSACLKGITPVISIQILECRPFQSGRGCFSDILGSQICVCFSPACTYKKGSSESKSGSVSNAYNSPSMARPTMVSMVFKNVCKKPTTFTSTQRSIEISCRKVESTRDAEFTETSGLDNLRQNLLAEGISERVSNPITNNRRTSSIKYYKSSWKKWYGWCSERETSSTRSTINYELDFLAELLEKALEYRTIGTHRSAISVF